MDYTPPPAIVQAAKQTKQPTLFLAISYVESRWDTNAVGKAGEIGALQLHPKFHEVPKSTKDQFKYAEQYVSYLRKRCGEQLFLACYNLGPKKVMNSLDKSIGLRYTVKVLEAYRVITETSIKNRRPLTPYKSTFRIAKDD